MKTAGKDANAMERAYFTVDVTDAGVPTSTLAVRPPNWVDDLIAMTRPGVDIEFPSRALNDRIIPFEYDDFS